MNEFEDIYNELKTTEHTLEEKIKELEKRCDTFNKLDTESARVEQDLQKQIKGLSQWFKLHDDGTMSHKAFEKEILAIVKRNEQLEQKLGTQEKDGEQWENPNCHIGIKGKCLDAILNIQAYITERSIDEDEDPVRSIIRIRDYVVKIYQELHEIEKDGEQGNIVGIRKAIEHIRKDSEQMRWDIKEFNKEEKEPPKGACPICFGEVLSKYLDIEDSEERFEKLSDWINELCAYDEEQKEQELYKEFITKLEETHTKILKDEIDLGLKAEFHFPINDNIEKLMNYLKGRLAR